ncbi:MAG: hypothetical protein JWP01_4200 [Myxococcales bacterium]|nr:hypothetical protein [Myxococcales bacterium]
MKLRHVLFLALIGCGPAVSGGDDTGGDDQDTDGDLIADAHEGRAEGTDTDADGTPDFEDEDSDGDGIPDYREAGDSDAETAPIDSDADGIPDFRDLDSDGNERTDTVDGVEDQDGDNVGAYADRDDDGDAMDDIVELGPNPQQPVDTDTDGIADFRDTDSDNDTIDDLYEGATDYDSDGTGNYIDLDSDGDCVSDRAEARGTPPMDTDQDHHADFIDRDSDNDGVPDVGEDENCNGTVDAGESSPTNVDTDADGVTDLVETAAGTDPANPASNPQANGDFVFVEPYQAPQMPLSSDLDFSTKLQAVDLYVMLDRSGSMSAEINSIKNNLASVVRNVACAPLGTGTPPNCIPDLWAGAATIGYHGSGATAFQNWVDIQPNASFAGVPITEPTGITDSQEPLTFGAYAAITGQGGANFTMGAVPARASCAGSPAANGGYQTFGYPCFRQGALPVVMLATDEPPTGAGDTYTSPVWSSVVKPEFLTRKAKLVGILGDGLNGTTQADLETMARDTGAVDALNGNAPLVFNGSGANAAAAIQTGILRLANGLPLDINATTTDDPTDAVNAIASFVDHLETLQTGSAQCASGLTDVDTNADTFKDKFVQVRTGTPVCWRVVSKQNTTVPATEAPQLFRATVRVYGDGVTQLDERDVFFLVPPKPFDGPIQ